MQVWLRVTHLREAFHQRLCEWELATILFVWGFFLLLPVDTLDSKSYAAFRMLMDQTHWGAFIALGGAMRLGALAVNGAWRPMYYVRAWLSVTTLVLWIMITLGILWSGSTGTGLAVYPVLAVFEVISLLRSARDAAIAEANAKATAGQQTQRHGDGQLTDPT